MTPLKWVEPISIIKCPQTFNLSPIICQLWSIRPPPWVYQPINLSWLVTVYQITRIRHNVITVTSPSSYPPTLIWPRKHLPSFLLNRASSLTQNQHLEPARSNRNLIPESATPNLSTDHPSHVRIIPPIVLMFPALQQRPQVNFLVDKGLPTLAKLDLVPYFGPSTRAQKAAKTELALRNELGA